MNRSCWQVGETGAGKTSIIRYLAYLTQNNFRRFNLNAQTEKSDFIGGHKPGNDRSFVWEDRILVEAMQKGYWLVLDEINLAPSQVIERINSLLDDDGFLVITEHEGEIYLKHTEYERRLEVLINEFQAQGASLGQAREKAAQEMVKNKYRPIHKDFRLFATMNPAQYIGRQVFSPALMNRFRVKWIDELPFEDMKEVILARFNLPAGLVDKIIGTFISSFTMDPDKSKKRSLIILSGIY